jgi:hypothetical protein
MKADRDDTRGSPRDYGTEALFATRARFFLTYRLAAVRLLQFAAPDGGARTAGWQLALVAFVALDVIQWSVLRKPERFGLKSRLALDTFDVALWSFAPYPHSSPYSYAVLLAIPLAVEAGMRLGFAGLVVPAVVIAGTCAARAALGRALDPQLFVWPVFAVGWGMLLSRYIGRLQRRGEKEWSQRDAAEQRRAFLAGQNAVAMGANSVVDVIEGLLPVLGPPEDGTVLWQFADAWKSALCQSTKGEAAYLGLVLAEWAADHNAHPDLSSRVEFHPAEGIGTTLLTGRQESALRDLLTQLTLRGTTPVSLTDPTVSSRPPGGPLRLQIGSYRLEVPADPDRPPRPYDPAPAAFAIVTSLMLADMVTLLIAPGAVAIGASLAIAAACWAHIRLRRVGEAARPSIMAVAVGVAVTYTALASLNLERLVNPGGLVNFPVVAALDLLALLGGFYWEYLKSATRLLTVAGAAAVFAEGWFLHRQRHDPLDLILQGVSVLPLLLTTLRLAREINASSGRYTRRLLARQTETNHAAFDEGQTTVIDLVRRAAHEAEARLVAVQGNLAPKLADYSRGKLEEVDRRLQKLTATDGSSSSTTIS